MRKKENYFLVFLILSILFMFNLKAEAATDSDYLLKIDKNGTIISGKPLPIDRPYVILEQRGSNEQFAKSIEIHKPGGSIDFIRKDRPTDTYYRYPLSYGDRIILRGLGTLENREVGLEITSEAREVPSDRNLYALFFEESTQNFYWKLPKIDSMTGGPLNNKNILKFRPVYTDKATIEGITTPAYFDFPINYTNRHVSAVGSINTKDITRLTFDTSNYENTNFSYRATDELLVASSGISLNGHVIVGNEQAISIRQVESGYQPGETTVGQSSALSIFQRTSKIPFTPEYNTPLIYGFDSPNSPPEFSANFEVIQSLPLTFDTYYPDQLDIFLDDTENSIKDLKESSFSILDQEGKDVTKQLDVTLTSVNESPNSGTKKFKLSLTKNDLIFLKGNYITIKLKLKSFNLENLKNHYNATTKKYEIPMSTYNERVVGTVRKKSGSNSAIAMITPFLTGEPVPTEVEQDTDSTSLDPINLVKNVYSSTPDDVVLFNVEKKVFRTLGSDTLKVTLSSKNNPSMTFVVTVPITVVNNPIMPEYFDNEKWLINEINNQLKPKQIGKDVYMKDLQKITAISLAPAWLGYTGQHIPPRIDALQNLTELSLRSTKLEGQLPPELGNLTKLTKLQINGNTFTGSIPNTITNLKELTLLDLEKNVGLTGTLPVGLNDLPKLVQLQIGGNMLVGSLPEFKQTFTNFDIRDSQLTVNTDGIPAFMANSTDAQRRNSFVTSTASLKLSGISNFVATSNGMKIKPFDSKNSGYFDLHIKNSTNARVDLYASHTFKIVNQNTGLVLYDGPANPAVEITTNIGDNFKVILDDAVNNPNNVFTIEGMVREYKLEKFPKAFTLNMKLDDFTDQALSISGADNLSIFDNRIDGKWQLKVKPSELKSRTKTLLGNYSYKTKKGSTIDIPIIDSFKTIASGNSDPVAGTINISNDWDAQNGLFYKQTNKHNYKDVYAGTLEWQIVDGPSE
ncbi:hypothetical protein A5881_003182 [Enterococcus termitis]|nr:hypothetical protein A5881_003670 [Enterococcus termitis]